MKAVLVSIPVYLHSFAGHGSHCSVAFRKVIEMVEEPPKSIESKEKEAQEYRIFGTELLKYVVYIII